MDTLLISNQLCTITLWAVDAYYLHPEVPTHLSRKSLQGDILPALRADFLHHHIASADHAPIATESRIEREREVVVGHIFV